MNRAAAERTPLEQARAAWRAARVVPAIVEHPALDAVLTELRRSHVNGGAEFACFDIPNAAALHALPRRSPDEAGEFFAGFLTLQVVRACPALSRLRITDPLPRTPDIAYGSTYTLDGEIARTIMNGGAYERFRGPGREAKALGAAFCDALFGDRYADVDLYYSPTPWSEWFFDVAWDQTWFGLDRRLYRLWMLCMTDTD